jgi:hypothetical protein
MGRPGDLYGPPIREASSRGGSGRFNWEEVKKDEKFRDTYLGHSLMAPVGRWQKGKDLNWYAKAEPTTAQQQREARAAEIRKIKEAEEEALAEALGFKVERKVQSEGVTKEEVEAALKDEDANGMETVQGLGFGRYDVGLCGETDGSVKPRIGATLPDGSVMQNHPAPGTSTNGVSVDVDVAIKLEHEGSEEVKQEERERRKHRHRHHRRDEDDEGRRHKHRHHRRDDRRERSRSPNSRTDRAHDSERWSDRRRENDGDRGSDRDRARDSARERRRQGSPRDSYRDRRDNSRRERSPYDREEGRKRRERGRSRER